MAKKRKKKEKPEVHPTLFVWEGVIRHYSGGSMLELYSNITMDEWKTIVEETISYYTFVVCLKEVAFPILKETWTEEDDWYRLQLEIAVSRIRNIDPLAINQKNVDLLKDEYTKKMQTNAKQLMEDIETMRSAQSLVMGRSSIVSDL